jgi:hypothetical protein
MFIKLRNQLNAPMWSKTREKKRNVSVLILFYNKSLCHEGTWESGDIASQFLSSVLDGSEFG